MPSADRKPPSRTPQQDTILRAFGQRVAELRRQTPDPAKDGKPYSQDRFALAVDLHRTVVSQVERGLVNVSLLTAHRIAAGLGVTISELTEGIDEPK